MSKNLIEDSRRKHLSARKKFQKKVLKSSHNLIAFDTSDYEQKIQTELCRKNA